MENNKRTELISAWKQARAAGQAQKEFCKDHGITDRTLRAWVASEGQSKVSIRQAEIVLRRLGRHLLQVAEVFGGGGPDLPTLEDALWPPAPAADSLKEPSGGGLLS